MYGCVQSSRLVDISSLLVTDASQGSILSVVRGAAIRSGIWACESTRTTAVQRQVVPIAPVKSASAGGRGTAEQLSEMATLAAQQLRGAVDAFTARDADAGREIDRDDNELDRLNRAVFDATLELDDAAERKLALRHVLIARSLERIGD